MRSLLVVFLMMSFRGETAPESGCPGSVSAADLQVETVQAAMAFAALDDVGFKRSATRAFELLGCVDEELSAAALVELHRTEALSAFFAGDSELARTAFQALLTVKRDWELPRSLADDGHPLRALFDEARARPRSLMVPFDPMGFVVLVDGQPSTERPANVPAVVQVLARGGEVLSTEYVRAGLSMVDLAGLVGARATPVAVASAPQAAPAEPKGRRDGRRTGLRLGLDVGGVEASARIEYRLPEQGVLDAVGVRGIVGFGLPSYVIAGAAPYVSFRLSRTVNIDVAGFAGTASFSGFAIGGGAAARWEPSALHLHAGLLAGVYSSSPWVMPDVGVGFVW